MINYLLQHYNAILQINT